MPHCHARKKKRNTRSYPTRPKDIPLENLKNTKQTNLFERRGSNSIKRRTSRPNGSPSASLESARPRLEKKIHVDLQVRANKRAAITRKPGLPSLASENWSVYGPRAADRISVLPCRRRRHLHARCSGGGHGARHTRLAGGGNRAGRCESACGTHEGASKVSRRARVRRTRWPGGGRAEGSRDRSSDSSDGVARLGRQHLHREHHWADRAAARAVAGGGKLP